MFNFNTLSSVKKLFENLSVNSKVVAVLIFFNKITTKTLNNIFELEIRKPKTKYKFARHRSIYLCVFSSLFSFTYESADPVPLKVFFIKII